MPGLAFHNILKACWLWWTWGDSNPPGLVAK